MSILLHPRKMYYPAEISFSLSLSSPSCHFLLPSTACKIGHLLIIHIFITARFQSGCMLCGNSSSTHSTFVSLASRSPDCCGFLSHSFPCRLSAVLPECFQLQQLPVWRGRGLTGSLSSPRAYQTIYDPQRETGGEMLCF